MSDYGPDDPIEEPDNPDYARSHQPGKAEPGCECSGCELLREGATVEDRHQDAKDYQECAEGDHQLQMCSQCYPAVDPPDIDLDDTRVPW
jgi:hypothetical protein